MRAAPDPRILTGWSGASPHVLRFPLRAFLRFPVCPPGSPPSPAFSWFPFVRRSPVRSLRPLPGFRVSFGVPPVSLPLGNFHDSAAGGRFRRRWSRAARAKVTSPAAATPRVDPAVILPHGRWATAGHEAMSLQNRLVRAAASPGRRCARTGHIDFSGSWSASSLRSRDATGWWPGPRSRLTHRLIERRQRVRLRADQLVRCSWRPDSLAVSARCIARRAPRNSRC
jgi:hypothetical protein